MNKHLTFAIPLLLGAMVMPSLGQAVSGKTYNNVRKDGVAIKGYDPVAYFTDAKPVKGDERFTSTHEGATYRFASEEHKKLFDADPVKYAVRYGGFCGYAVSRGYTADVDPAQFVITEGRLVLQNNAGALKLWNKDAAASAKSADANWPKLVEKKGK
jgi:YHS domain-containing protein